MGPTSNKSIPNFLTAATPQGLRRFMFLNNVKYGMFFKYFDIQFVNGRWYAWYFNEPESTSKDLIGEAK